VVKREPQLGSFSYPDSSIQSVDRGYPFLRLDNRTVVIHSEHNSAGGNEREICGGDSLAR